MDLFDAALAPFTIALMVMAGFAVLEVVGLLFGAGPGAALDSMLPDLELPDLDAEIDFDVDAEIEMAVDGATAGLDAPLDADLGGDPGTFLQFLSWLGVGKVPALIVLVTLLMSFGLTGILGQQAFQNFAGAYAPGWLAGIAAFIAALPITSYISRGVAKVFPKEESDAVSTGTFIGKVAVIFRGTAKSGQPAEAKLKDFVGTVHYLLVEPDLEGDEFVEGDEILLVSKDGAKFKGIRNTQAALSPAL